MTMGFFGTSLRGYALAPADTSLYYVPGSSEGVPLATLIHYADMPDTDDESEDEFVPVSPHHTAVSPCVSSVHEDFPPSHPEYRMGHFTRTAYENVYDHYEQRNYQQHGHSQPFPAAYGPSIAAPHPENYSTDVAAYRLREQTVYQVPDPRNDHRSLHECGDDPWAHLMPAYAYPYDSGRGRAVITVDSEAAFEPEGEPAKDPLSPWPPAAPRSAPALQMKTLGRLRFYVDAEGYPVGPNSMVPLRNARHLDTNSPPSRLVHVEHQLPQLGHVIHMYSEQSADARWILRVYRVSDPEEGRTRFCFNHSSSPELSHTLVEAVDLTHSIFPVLISTSHTSSLPWTEQVQLQRDILALAIVVNVTQIIGELDVREELQEAFTRELPKNQFDNFLCHLVGSVRCPHVAGQVFAFFCSPLDAVCLVHLNTGRMVSFIPRRRSALACSRAVRAAVHFLCQPGPTFFDPEPGYPRMEGALSSEPLYLSDSIDRLTLWAAEAEVGIDNSTLRVQLHNGVLSYCLINEADGDMAALHLAALFDEAETGGPHITWSAAYPVLSLVEEQLLTDSRRAEYILRKLSVLHMDGGIEGSTIVQAFVSPDDLDVQALVTPPGSVHVPPVTFNSLGSFFPDAQPLTTVDEIPMENRHEIPMESIFQEDPNAGQSPVPLTGSHRSAQSSWESCQRTAIDTVRSSSCFSDPVGAYGDVRSTGAPSFKISGSVYVDLSDSESGVISSNTESSAESSLGMESATSGDSRADFSFQSVLIKDTTESSTTSVESSHASRGVRGLGTSRGSPLSGTFGLSVDLFSSLQRFMELCSLDQVPHGKPDASILQSTDARRRTAAPSDALVSRRRDGCYVITSTGMLALVSTDGDVTFHRCDDPVDAPKFRSSPVKPDVDGPLSLLGADGSVVVTEPGQTVVTLSDGTVIRSTVYGETTVITNTTSEIDAYHSWEMSANLLNSHHQWSQRSALVGAEQARSVEYASDSPADCSHEKRSPAELRSLTGLSGDVFFVHDGRAVIVDQGFFAVVSSRHGSISAEGFYAENSFEIVAVDAKPSDDSVYATASTLRLTSPDGVVVSVVPGRVSVTSRDDVELCTRLEGMDMTWFCRSTELLGSFNAYVASSTLDMEIADLIGATTCHVSDDNGYGTGDVSSEHPMEADLSTLDIPHGAQILTLPGGLKLVVLPGRYLVVDLDGSVHEFNLDGATGPVTDHDAHSTADTGLTMTVTSITGAVIVVGSGRFTATLPSGHGRG
ncbi:MAG: uncharacterized protein KVP18_003412 [Porospora cf. gigantea A]|uniref:uncharacterized protein n=1 Tax=Porospora cf. gigantea A TaxID=2853593 RepID=UPI00355AA83A|nr:MAG: hypothetical protein KVP18_003412 [Porospora cf. gigantea A]